MPSSTLTSRGRVTIPKTIRDLMGLREGHRVAFQVLGNGTVVIEPETIDLLDLAGSLKPRRKGVTVAEMDTVVEAETGSRDGCPTIDE